MEDQLGFHNTEKYDSAKLRFHNLLVSMKIDDFGNLPDQAIVESERGLLLRLRDREQKLIMKIRGP